MRHSVAYWLVGILLGAMALASGCDGTRVEPEVNGHIDPGGPVLDVHPLWSPVDSTRIGYTHFAQSQEELQEWGERSVWIVDTSTGVKQRLTDGMLFDWSPDGEEILLARSYVGVFLRDLQSGEEKEIPVLGGPMDIAPGGEEIAFVSLEEPEGLYILDLESLTSRWIAPRYECDWSPDGKTILCDSLIVIDRDGTRIGKVPWGFEVGSPVHARWSPDGRSIAFGQYCTGRTAGIFVIDADGSDQRVVACPGAGPSWSPDGRRLAYSAGAENHATAIWVVNADGTAKRQVTYP